MADGVRGKVGATNAQALAQAQAKAAADEARLAAAARALEAKSTVAPAPKYVPKTGGGSPGAVAERMAAARTALAAQNAGVKPGVQAARTLYEASAGLENRNARLDTANRKVRDLEAKLVVQLAHLAPVFSQDERQAFADSFRKQHTAEYAEANAAAESLASYVKDQAGALAEATKNLASHPMPGAVEELPGRAQAALDQAAATLETAIRQSPTGSQMVAQSLAEADQAFTQAGAKLAMPEVVTSGTTAEGLSQLARVTGRFGPLAKCAGAAFGVVGDALGRQRMRRGCWVAMPARSTTSASPRAPASSGSPQRAWRESRSARRLAWA